MLSCSDGHYPHGAYVSRVMLDRSRRADHVRGVRKPRLLVSSLACAALATVVLGAAACGTTTRPRRPRHRQTPATPTATPTPTVDPTDAAILNAYDQAVTAWFAAAADPGAQDPGIVEWYTGVALTLAQGRLSALQQSDGSWLGTYTPHPVVTNLDGSTATVQDCGWNTTYVADEGTTTAVSSEAGAPTMPFNETGRCPDACRVGSTSPRRWSCNPAPGGSVSNSWRSTHHARPRHPLPDRRRARDRGRQPCGDGRRTSPVRLVEAAPPGSTVPLSPRMHGVRG